MGNKRDNEFNATEFFNETFGTLHLLQDEDDEIWFIGREIVDKLGYAGNNNAGKAITNFVNEEDRKALKYRAFSDLEKAILWQNPNDYSDKWIINECGFYDLLMHSNAKAASSFQHWVTHTVLPSIRKNGGYIMGQELLDVEKERLLNAQIAELFEEVKCLREMIEKKNEKLKEAKQYVETNRLCRSQYKRALHDIDRMTRLFEIEDRYNEYLRQRDVDRDIEMETLRHQLYQLRILVMTYGRSDLVNAAIRDGLVYEAKLQEQVLPVGTLQIESDHGTNCFLRGIRI